MNPNDSKLIDDFIRDILDRLAALERRVSQLEGAGAQPISKYNATSVPTTSDDINRGYGVGSVWVNTSTAKVYTCTANTAGAAIWSVLN